MLYSDLFNLNNKKILVIGQGGPTDELLLKRFILILGVIKIRLLLENTLQVKEK